MEKKLVSAAGGILIRQKRSDFFIAMLKDNKHKWVLPKGHSTHNEESNATAARELQEELMIGEELTSKHLIGATLYDFEKNNQLFQKKVKWFLFKTEKALKIRPQINEDFIQAKWLNFSEAIASISYPKEKAILIRAIIFELFENSLKEKLYSIILCGSNSGLEKDVNCDWGDIDLLIITERLNLKVKQSIAEVSDRLYDLLDRRISVDVLTKNDFLDSKSHVPFTKGKIFQSLIELKIFPDRFIYLKDEKINFYSPSANEIKKFSYYDIGQSLSRNRRSLCSTDLNKIGNLKEIVEKEINASFIITKLAIQKSKIITATSKKDTVTLAKKFFNRFDFKALDNNLLAISNWQSINSKKELLYILEQTDKFIEEFTLFLYSQNR